MTTPGPNLQKPEKESPQEILKRWLPHLLLLGLLFAAVAFFLTVFYPLRDPIILAICLACLTYPILFNPILSCIPKTFSELQRRNFAGMGATAALIIILFSPIILMIISIAGSIESASELALGVATKNPQVIETLSHQIAQRISDASSFYTNFPIDQEKIQTYAKDQLEQLGNFKDFGTNFLMFLLFLKGTGGVVTQIFLALITLSFLYAHGPWLVQKLIDYTPLSIDQREELLKLHRNIVLRLLSDTLATSVIKGLALGTLAYFIAGFPFFIVTFLGIIISLIPFIGCTMVWLPLASFLYTQENYALAIVLGLTSFSADMGISYLRRTLGNRLHNQSSWMSFLLFLSIIGGLIGFGVKGFIIGPMIVVLTSVIGSFWLPLYGIGKAKD